MTQMLKIFTVSLLFLISCVTNRPDWYLLNNVNSGFIIVNGEGKTADEAKTNALSDIARQLEVRISAETHLKEKESETESSLLFEQTIDIATDIVLTGAKRFLEEKRGDLYYVQYRYDNRPLRIQILDAARKNEITALSHNTENSFSNKLPFYHFLKKNRIPSDFFLSYDNQIWSVSIGNQSFSLSGRDFSEDFFYSGGEGDIALNQGMLSGSTIIGQPLNTLQERQNFSITINPPVTGFLTLFYVDNAGISVKLLDNIRVQEDEAFYYPDSVIHSAGIIAEMAEGFIYSSDMLLGLFTSEPLDQFSDFPSVSELSVDSGNEGLYNYGRLLELLKNEQSRIIWSSLIIHVNSNKSK